jgi:hypothetical protein
MHLLGTSAFTPTGSLGTCDILTVADAAACDALSHMHRCFLWHFSGFSIETGPLDGMHYILESCAESIDIDNWRGILGDLDQETHFAQLFTHPGFPHTHRLFDRGLNDDSPDELVEKTPSARDRTGGVGELVAGGICRHVGGDGESL